MYHVLSVLGVVFMGYISRSEIAVSKFMDVFTAKLFYRRIVHLHCQ